MLNNNLLKVSDLFSIYAISKRKYMQNKNADQKKIMMSDLDNLLKKTRKMIDDIYDSASSSEERDIIESYKLHEHLHY